MDKTDKMLVVELKHRGRDVRDVMDEYFRREGTLAGAAEAMDVDPSTVSLWLHGPLRGAVVGRGADLRLSFADFLTAHELENGLPSGVSALALAGVR